MKTFKNNSQKVTFIKYGIRARCYGLIARIFKSKAYLDKAVDCWDKRWEMMTNKRK